MKILAIRGKNLNSLADEFEVRLDAPPLAGAGLFAIVGPTGAGKSTLLDAMCLALFGQVPRLLAIEGKAAPVGRADQDDKERIPANDPRSMLRRGAVRGLAQVDFLGKDRKAYRATWSVHRALSKPDGKVLEPKFSLVELGTGAPLNGSGKKESLKQIEARLGLSFDQFRRSAMLAQGDFAAFLKARAEERADLLERITGTELYSKLSKAAHQRRAEEQKRLDELEQALAGIASLTAEERTAIDSERTRLRGELEASEKRREVLSAAVAWHVRDAELAQSTALANTAVAELQARADENRALRLEVEQARHAESLRPTLEAVDRATVAREQAIAQVASAQSAVEQRAQSHAEQEAALPPVRAAVESALAEEQALAPELAQAESMDVQLAAAERELGTAQAELRRATEAQTTAVAEKARASDALAQAAHERESCNAWLREHAADQVLAERWSVWEGELERVRTALERTRACAAELPRAEQAVSAAEAAKTRAETERATASAKVAELRTAAEALHHALETAPVETFRQARVDAEAQLSKLVRAQELGRELDAVEAQSAEAGAQVSAAERDAAAQRAEAERLSTELVRLESRVDEARHAEAEIRKRLGHQAERAELVPGQPCPLCGALEHPFVGQDAVVDQLLDDAVRRVKQLRKEHDAAVKLRAKAQAQADQHAQAQVQAQHRLEAADEARRDAIDRWVAAWGTEQWGPRLRSDLQARVETQRRVVAEAAGGEQHALAQASEAIAAAKARDVAAEQERQASEAARVAEAKAVAAAHALEKLGLEAATQERKLNEALEALAPVLGAEARAEVLSDPPLFIRRSRARAEAWRVQQERATKAVDRERSATATLKLAAGAETAAGSEVARWTAASGERQGEVTQLRQQRQRLLQGRPVASERLRLRTALDSAREKLAIAERAEAQARLEHQHAVQALTAARERVIESERLLASASNAAREAIAASGLDEGAVRDALAFGREWLDAQEAQLQSAATELERARAVLAERERQQHEHQHQSKPELSRADAEWELHGLTEKLRSLHEQAAELTQKLAADDAAVGQLRERAAELDRQRERFRVWGALGELIGSHDGKSFRLFAQSLTLEALLVPANRQLADLAPRYRLMRVPGHDLDLQVVDRDLADEVRSVASLSGGESFLVSLALALGLSSLSASQTPVETLFIDEGFGTLDPDTLEMVLSILDSLQATGRQVGVISHVPGLGERIGAQVHVEKLGHGRSRVRVVGAEPTSQPASERTA